MSVTAIELVPGTYTATVTIRGDDTDPVEVRVTLQVGAGAELEVNRSVVQFSAVEGEDPDAESVSVTSTGAAIGGLQARITYGAGQPEGWLTAVLGGDVTPTPLRLTSSVFGPAAAAVAGTAASAEPEPAAISLPWLEPGTYRATVTISGDGVEPVDVLVILEIEDRAELVVSDAPVAFTTTAGEDPDAKSVSISSTGDPITGLETEIAYNPGQPTGWLSATLDDDATPTSLQLSATVAGLEPGSYNATVTIRGDGVEPVDVPVILEIEDQPELVVGDTPVVFTTAADEDPDAKSVSITSTGASISGLGTSIAYLPAQATGWLSAILDDDATPTSLQLSAAVAGLEPGTYRATVSVSGDGVDPVDILVVLVIEAPPAVIQATPREVTFEGFASTTPAPQEVQVTASKPVRMTHTVTYGEGQATGWLSAELDGMASPTVLGLQANPAGLAPGTYNAVVTITAPGALPDSVSVQLKVLEPVLVGLELEVNGTMVDEDGILSFDLVQLLSDPILDLTVRGVFSDGSTQDVTSAATLTPGSAHVGVTGPGVLDVASAVTNALVVPAHLVKVTYGGLEVEFTIQIDAPELNALDITSIAIDPGAAGSTLAVGSPLPSVIATLDDGVGGTASLVIPGGHPGIAWTMKAHTLECSGSPIDPCWGANLILSTLTIVGNVLGISDGVVTELDASPFTPILGLFGGELHVDVTAAFDGVDDLVTDPVAMVIPLPTPTP